MNLVGSILLILITFSFSAFAESYHQAAQGGSSSLGNGSKNNPTGRKVSRQEMSSGVNTLAAITGDTRVAAIANSYTGYELVKEGYGTWPTGWPLIALGGLEFVQAGVNLSTSKEAKGAGNYLSNDGNGEADFGDGSDGNSGGINDSNSDGSTNLDDEFTVLSNDPNVKAIYGSVPNAGKGLRDLEKKGFKFNKETGEVTLPDGSTASRSDLQKAAQKAAGTAKFKKLKRSLAQKKKAYLNRISRFRSGGSGGYKSSAMNKKGSNRNKAFNMKFGNKGSRGIASVPGKIKMVNGDPLGAASDNVFHIVERAYQGLVTSKVLQENIPKVGN